MHLFNIRARDRTQNPVPLFTKTRIALHFIGSLHAAIADACRFKGFQRVRKMPKNSAWRRPFCREPTRARGIGRRIFVQVENIRLGELSGCRSGEPDMKASSGPPHRAGLLIFRHSS
jgi:hypothetical protein